ncbi:HSF-type DNA-binding-domain-containing protein [Mycena galopus ATCC 62051]|nr:HSF-type DNA-binding-domain-containing protein [Mycena galopus ATCC 62051]
MDQTLCEKQPLLSDVRTQSELENFAVSSKLASKPSRKDRDSSESQTQDFVKKLYKMLEDNTLQDVISWGAQGNSFVDVNQFTVSILPHIFKHSNFASFVRQLNKYDFHKIKHVDDNSWAEPASKWEFKHAHFRAGCRNALQNIKRKTGPRSTGSPEFERQNLRIDSLNARLTSLSAAQQDIVSSVRTLERSHEEVLLQLARFQRGMAKRNEVLGRLVHHLGRESGVTDAGQCRFCPYHANLITLVIEIKATLLDKVPPMTARKSPADVPEERAADAAGMFFEP